MAPRRPPRVLDASDGISGAYAAHLLAQVGSDVVRVEPDGGDPMRRWRHGDGEIGDEGSVGSALYEYLRAGQRAARFGGDPFDVGADVVIASPRGAVCEALQAAARADPSVIAVAVTPYGLRGPCRDHPATDFTLQADSGALAIRGAADRAPYQMGGRTCEWLAGAYAAAAALVVWEGRCGGGRGGVIDVSIAEANYLGGANFFDLYHAMLLGPDEEPVGSPRQPEIPSIERTKDGWVGFNTNAPHQVQAFLRMMGREDLVESGEFAMPSARLARAEEWNAMVSAWTTARTTAELVELAVAHKVPVAPVCDGRTVVDLEQVRARGALVAAASGRFHVPARPWRVDGRAGPAPGSAPASPRHTAPAVEWRDPSPAPAVRPAGPGPGRALEGLEVLDLTTWWAGPSASALLAAFGARVVHVESPSRMDGVRMVGATFFDRPEWWERSWFFLAINSNKLGLSLEIDGQQGRELALHLVRRADVVIENATPRVLDKLGLGWDVIRQVNPRAVLVRMPAFGLDGPWSDRPGFAQTIEQASGLAWITGPEGEQPRIQRGPCDPNGGQHAVVALCAALADRERTGRGSLVEASMFEAALAIAAEPILEWSAYGNLVGREGNRSVHAAPQGLYPCAGADSWLAVSIETDDQWRALAGVIGRADLLEERELGSRGGRRRDHDRLDDVITAWTRGIDAEDAAASLVAAGVPAAVARDPRLAARHPQFKARGFHESVDHAVAGRVPVPTLPYRVDGVECWIRCPAPTFGEHNDEILGSMLGLSAEEIEELRAAGTIADRPVGF